MLSRQHDVHLEAAIMVGQPWQPCFSGFGCTSSDESAAWDTTYNIRDERLMAQARALP